MKYLLLTEIMFINCLVFSGYTIVGQNKLSQTGKRPAIRDKRSSPDEFIQLETSSYATACINSCISTQLREHILGRFASFQFVIINDQDLTGIGFFVIIFQIEFLTLVLYHIIKHTTQATNYLLFVQFSAI